jgi:hypothetical protein
LEDAKMARAIEELRSGTTVGYAALGLHGDEQGTVGQQVHDGDTVVVRATGKEPDEAVGNLSHFIDSEASSGNPYETFHTVSLKNPEDSVAAARHRAHSISGFSDSLRRPF